MGTIAQKLAKLEATKADIKTSITEKGITIPANATFASFPGYIDQITTGIEPTGNIELQKQSGTNVTNYATASVKSGSASTPATTKAQSSPTFTQEGNLITADVAATSVSVTPTVSAGWVSSGTAGIVTMSASSNTYEIPLGSAETPATTKQQSKPTFSQDGNVVTASVAATSVKVTPDVTAGYISSGTEGTITMSANSNTYTIPVGSATTPATTKQQSAPTFTQSGNVVTASVAATSVKVTPTVSAGYVSTGTEGTITMSANSNTYTIPAGSASTPATTKQQSKPTFSQSGNVVTASVAATSVDITPTVSAGYVSAGTKGTVTMSANNNTYTIPAGSATTPATTKQQSAPTFSLSGTTLTASVAATSVNVTPTVSAGYVSSGTAGTVTMSANSATYTIPTETKTATDNGDVTPSSGKFLSKVTVNVPYKTYRTGTGAPSSSLGNDGDIYIDLS